MTSAFIQESDHEYRHKARPQTQMCGIAKGENRISPELARSEAEKKAARNQEAILAAIEVAREKRSADQAEEHCAANTLGPLERPEREPHNYEDQTRSNPPVLGVAHHGQYIHA